MRKLNVTDGQTDRQKDGGVAISPVPGPTAPAGDNKFFICENINIFGYLRGQGGGGGCNNQTGPILVHIYPLFYINLHVKYRNNMIKPFEF